MMTVAEQIRWLQQYHPDDVVADPVETVRGPGNGRIASPILMWLRPGEEFRPGDRVRKPGYPDTGTVTDIANARHLAGVRWDNTGSSWEPVDGIGRAVAL